MKLKGLLEDVGAQAWVDAKQPNADDAGDPDCASLSFPHPKMDANQVRFLTGFEELNKHIVRRPFALPKISDMFHKDSDGPLQWT